MTTIRITGTPLLKIAPKIQNSLDKALLSTLTKQQRDLSVANPKDTGRMASSWFIGHNSPSAEVRPEKWAKPGKQRVEVEEYAEKVTFDGDWFISNNVPYAQYIALNYQPSVSKAQKDWFTSISNQMGNVFVKEFEKVNRRGKKK
jgi:hypothetical protein